MKTAIIMSTIKIIFFFLEQFSSSSFKRKVEPKSRKVAYMR